MVQNSDVQSDPNHSENPTRNRPEPEIFGFGSVSGFGFPKISGSDRIRVLGKYNFGLYTNFCHFYIIKISGSDRTTKQTRSEPENFRFRVGFGSAGSDSGSDRVGEASEKTRH